jgi:hypothetical protein
VDDFAEISSRILAKTSSTLETLSYLQYHGDFEDPFEFDFDEEDEPDSQTVSYQDPILSYTFPKLSSLARIGPLRPLAVNSARFPEVTHLHLVHPWPTFGPSMKTFLPAFPKLQLLRIAGLTNDYELPSELRSYGPAWQPWPQWLLDFMDPNST